MEVNPKFSTKAQKDFEYVTLAQKGNQNAFAELMNRYREAIYFMTLKMTNNKNDAEDLTIETFAKAFKKIEQYSPSFAFSTWLFKIASNNCIDFLRKKKTRQLSIFSSSNTLENNSLGKINEDTSLSIQSDLPDPEEALIKEQKNLLLRKLVNNLKPRYRQLVELRYFKELSYEEIAKEMNIPIGTVKAQLFRSRELLSVILKKRKNSL